MMLTSRPSGLSCIALLLVFHSTSAADSENPKAVLHMRTGPIKDQNGHATVNLGIELSLYCRINNTRIRKCGWIYDDPLDPLSTPVTVLVTTLNYSTVKKTSLCILNIKNVTQTHSGRWSCQGLFDDEDYNNATDLYKSDPVILHVVPGNDIEFETSPTNRTFSIGNTADLECTTNVPVQSCRWSFQQAGQTEPLVVREAPPKDDTDCSFHLDNISYEQVGWWKCGARMQHYDNYTYTDTAYIQVEHKEEAFPIEFVGQPEDTEMHIGMPGELSCTVCAEAHIEECKWYWQPVGRSRGWSLLVREFLPTNTNDCTVLFPQVTSDMEGLWTCHVKPIHSSTFEMSKSAIVTVRAEVAVSVLSREVSVIEGEELVLSCLVEDMVDMCHWKRRDLYDSNTSGTLTDNDGLIYPPTEKSRDCSLTITHAKKEHQGLWNCGMKLVGEELFKYTLPTAVSIKLPKKVRFIEGSRTKLAAENKPVTLNCTTLSAVEQCMWLWSEDHTKIHEGVVKYQSTHNNGVYDCSIEIPSTNRSHQGFWQCAVGYKFNNITSLVYAQPFSLTVMNPADIIFREVTRGVNGQPGPDGRVMLECVTLRPVQECLWLHHFNNDSEARQVAKFEPQNFNNCTYLVEAAVSSGTWTCGARNPGDTNFTMAQPTAVALVQQGTVVAKARDSLTTCDVELQCQLLDVSALPVSCQWIHPSGYNVLELNETGKYFLEGEPKLQSCSVRFHSTLLDMGSWKCIFSCNNQTHILGQTTITLLNTSEYIRGWVVGVLAASVIVLTILLFSLLTCYFLHLRKKQATVHLKDSTSQRYTADPTSGINFSFNETPELLVDFEIPTQSSSSHHYERVGHFLPSKNSFYQNVN